MRGKNFSDTHAYAINLSEANKSWCFSCPNDFFGVCMVLSHAGSVGYSRMRSMKNDDVQGTPTRMFVLAVHNREARESPFPQMQRKETSMLRAI